MQAEKGSDYVIQVQKTLLYFSNPHWLHYQLSEEKYDDERLGFEPSVSNVGKHEADIIEDGSSNEDTSQLLNIDSSNKVTSAISPAHEFEPQLTKRDSFESVNIAVNIGSAPIYIPQESEQQQSPEVTQAEEETAALTRDTNVETDNFINHLYSSNATPNTTDTTVLDDLPSTVETEMVELKEEMAGVTQGSDNITEKFLEETQQVNGQKGQIAEDDEHDIMFKNIKAMLDATSEEADADTKDAVVPIDPYYTIDYFASQGIKLELDKNPQDQLGQNLKKFTHWLRHMKKLGPEDATEAINRTESETDIQQIADSSNTVREVVTEAMALVLEKQGKKEKAIELYNKLSFLNPHKNAYFADKIKKLKGT